MRTHTQNKPLGTDAATDFAQQQQSRAQVELQVYGNTDIGFRQTTRGTQAYLKNKTRPVQQAAGPSFFELVSDGGDWYNCYSFDGLTVGIQIIKVAKNQDLCCILPTASPAGLARTTRLNYDGTTDIYGPYTPVMVGGVVGYYTRAVTCSDGSTATSYVIPKLSIGDIITADPCTFNGPASLAGVQWIARTDGRTWTDLINLPTS